MTDPRPLVPVNPEGLEDLANELLVPTSPISSQTTDIDSSLKNPENYLLLPGRSHGSYSYPDFWVAKHRLGYDADVEKAAKKISLTLKNTGEEKNGHKYAGKMNQQQALDLNTNLGNSTLNQRQYLDFILLLKSGNAVDGRGRKVKKSELDVILDEIIGKSDSWRSEWISNKFVEENNKLHIIYPVFKNGKIEEIRKPLGPYISKENCYVDFSSFNKQGMPTTKSANQEYRQGENIYYWYPRNGAVAGFVAGSGGAVFDCYCVPSYSVDSLGVRAAARAKI